jgi:hypothetical protein
MRFRPDRLAWAIPDAGYPRLSGRGHDYQVVGHD